MELFLNTSNPIMILSIVLIISLVIYISRKAEVAWPLIIVMAGVVCYLIYHSVTLDKLEKDSELVTVTYHCLACDLIFMLI